MGGRFFVLMGVGGGIEVMVLMTIISIKYHIALIILIFCCILFIFILNLCSWMMILAQSE